jgi:hypothetical protein
VQNLPLSVNADGDTLEGAVEGIELELKKYLVLDTATGRFSGIAVDKKMYYDRITGDTITSDMKTNENLWIDTVGGIPTFYAGDDPNLPATAWEARYNPAIKRYIETDEYQYQRSGFYYTHQGIKLMGRITFNFQEITGADFKLFAEAALLGVKNYDGYYEKPAERMPIMFGINIPTFGLLDLLTVQGEYYNSPYRNSLEQVYGFMAVPTITDYDHEIVDDDNFHWSIYTKKTIVPGMQLYVQAASDHLRLNKAGYTFTNEPLTSKATQWYYIAKLEFGI